MSDKLRPASDLALQALLYCTDSLTPAAQSAFENRLADDQKTRDAVVHAAALLETCSERRTQPNPAYRARVRERLLGTPSWVDRVSARRPQRGHPLAWIGIGAAAAALLFWLLPAPPAPTTFVPVVHVPSPLYETDLEEARLWEEMPRGEHLFATHREQSRRRQRHEQTPRLVKRDEIASSRDDKIQ